jgi:hypothetical protein
MKTNSEQKSCFALANKLLESGERHRARALAGELMQEPGGRALAWQILDRANGQAPRERNRPAPAAEIRRRDATRVTTGAMRRVRKSTSILPL